jgi:AcrR family transcriptional regulator
MAESGLRERKNARTRAAIERAALELAIEQGFERTTVDQIAERADVSPRTVFGRYTTKDAIVFGDVAAEQRAFEAWLEEAQGDLLERVAAYIRGLMEGGESDELAHLRLRAMLVDPYLRRVFRGRLDAFEHTIAERLARELGRRSDDVRVRAFSAGVAGLLLAIADRAFVDPEGADPLGDLEDGVAFLRTALDGLRTP